MGAKKIFSIAVGVLLAICLILQGVFGWKQQMVFFDLCLILAVTGIAFAAFSIKQENGTKNGTKTCIITTLALALALAAFIGVVLFFAKMTDTSHFAAFELLLIGAVGGFIFEWLAKKFIKSDENSNQSKNGNESAKADANAATDADTDADADADADAATDADADADDT